jgi:long-chain acyl-CoA synthetase
MDYAARYDKWQTLPQVFFDKAGERGDAPMFWEKRYNAWQAISWARAREEVVALARELRASGVERGDRVLLVSENRPEWGLADLAIMAAGAITVPAYTTNTVHDHAHLINDCDPRLAIVSTNRLAERLLSAIRQNGQIRTVVTIDGAGGATDGIDIINWRDMIRRGAARDDNIEGELLSIARTDTACLIYTSGTGGAPKGVMLSHGAIICNCMGAYHLFKDCNLLELDNETFLSFLPLSHSYEHTAGLHFPISIGAQVYYAEGVDKLSDNMTETHPTIMTAVPRLYESMHQRIVAGIERKGGLSEKLFKKAIALGIKRYEQGKGSLSLCERLQDALVEKLVRKRVAERFGGRLKAFVSGGAPLNYDIGVFFLALGVRLLQGYGQTETAPVVSANPPLHIKIDTVGPALPGVEVKIAEDGEILIRGELTMQGYWGAPDLTAKTLIDGWVYTGDIGELDADGYIRITDRKKDLIVNSGGDNVSPQRVEGVLVFEPELAQAMVYGDKHPHLVAVVVPDDGFIAEWAREKGREANLAELADSESFHDRLREAIERANERLSPIEQVRRFLVSDEAFTTENGLMTPSLKIRRHEIRKIYGERLEALYGRRKS